MLATLTDWLWTYVLIAALLIVGLRFTLASRFVQLRLFAAMFSQLRSSRLTGTDRGISGFQALVVSVAGRVGGGNIAGVAVAITLGGPGALFWMWLIALLGMATSIFECALAQLFKRRHAGEVFRGGPAFYMRHGLGWRVMPVVYSVLQPASTTNLDRTVALIRRFLNPLSLVRLRGQPLWVCVR